MISTRECGASYVTVDDRHERLCRLDLTLLLSGREGCTFRYAPVD